MSALSRSIWVSQGISWAALNQTVCALRSFYGVTLDRAEIPERIVYARTPRKLPEILSADEVWRFLEAVSSLKAARRAAPRSFDAICDAIKIILERFPHRMCQLHQTHRVCPNLRPALRRGGLAHRGPRNRPRAGSSSSTRSALRA